MIYIIDANNLAGKLKMLGEVNFDKKLIRIIGEYYRKQPHKILLVFDGQDPLGDRIAAGANITVIYSPRDKYYRSADDKIVEMIMTRRGLPAGQNVCVVTDDVGLKNRVEEAYKENRQPLTIERATDLAQKLLKKSWKKETGDVKEDGKRGLKENDINKINNDLLKLWKK